MHTTVFDVGMLWRAVDEAVGPYPPGVERVPEPIPGTAFFPGGYSIWRPDGTRQVLERRCGGVMVIGQDFHSAAGYRKSLAAGSEWPHVPTLRTLRQVLEAAGVDLDSCFLTNTYMGLRSGQTATGQFPGEQDQAFVARCDRFLGRQIATALPRLILTLGKPAFRAAGRVLGIPGWAAAERFRDLDAGEPGALMTAEIPGNGAVVAVAALLHPSLRTASLRHRRYKGQVGDAAELALLADALAAAGH